MKRGRLPLTALRSFEVAGRLLSFTRAAEELFVSQAAISRQIRDLEASLGHALFERRHRAVTLTPEGAGLLGVLTESFDRIDSALSAIAAREAAASVTISVEPSFAALWMVPNLPAFRSLHPEIEVSIESDPRLVEFRGNETVLALRHGSGRSTWPRAEARLLVRTSMIPVLSPSLIERGAPLRTPADIRQFDLLHEENRSYWQDWFRMAGAAGENGDRGPVFADGGLVLQAALRGHGAALSDPIFFAEDLRSGRLVAPFDVRMPCGAYYLVARSFRNLPKPAAAFADWLTAQFAALSADTP